MKKPKQCIDCGCYLDESNEGPRCIECEAKRILKEG